MCRSDPPPIVRTGALRDEGWSRRDIRDALSAGRLSHIRRGVYAREHACREVRTAALHGGSLACETAARHLGIWVLPQPGVAPHVWMTGRGHRRGCALADGACGCVEHWDDGPLPASFALPSVPRILRQLLVCHGTETFFAAIESALYLGLLDSRGIRWLRRSCPAAAHEALDLARHDAQSGLESLLRWRLRHVAVRVRTQVAIAGVGVVDALLGERLIVELDGEENHGSRELRHRDRMRDASAAQWGYVTLRFDYAMVVDDWPTVEAAILSHLEAGIHLGGRDTL